MSYILTEPTQICFSGGRTSGYMLHHILEANGGLPADCIVTFQNTGKETTQTLDFIQECSQRWSVPIAWIEWDGFIPPGRNKCNFRIVDRDTCSTNGEPFAKMIESLGYLPNPTQRLCTANLKVKAGEAFMRSIGYAEWQNAMGIRADEQRRVSRLRSAGRDNSCGSPCLPLADLGVTKAIVGAFWKRQPFDLAHGNNNGVTPHGNCDLCFLKGAGTVMSLIRENPELADWWIAQEQKITHAGNAGQCGRFRSDRPSYTQMKEYAINQIEFKMIDDNGMDCFCGDGS